MYRVITIIASAATLAACSSTPDWMNFDALKPAPIKDTVTLESNPPGAQARASSGETCVTPCTLALASGAPVSVTFSLAGHNPETEQLELISMGDGTSRLQPNPVSVDLAAAAPPPPARKPAPKKPAPKKPAAASAKPAATTTAAAPPAATTAAAPAASPWPSTTQPAR